MKHNRDQRRTRREILQQFERAYDLQHYDYKKLINPALGKSKLIGVAVASIIYGAVFGIAYMAWINGRVAYELFMKTTWVLLLPASAIGIFSWMLAFNRLDNKIRAPLQRLIEKVEGEAGTLWRYAPLLAADDPKNTAAKTACNRSREQQFKLIDAEDYCSAVNTIHAALKRTEDTPMAQESLQEVAANLLRGD